MSEQISQELIVKEIAQKQVWEDFLMGQSRKTFLNSWNWGEFQRKMREKIWRLGVYDGEQLIAIALVIKVSARRGSFLLVPHGPASALRATAGEATLSPEAMAGEAFLSPEDIVGEVKTGILEILIQKLKKIAKQEKCSFIRMSPIWPARIGYAEGVAGGVRNEENTKVFQDLGFKRAPIQTHPEASWKLDISLSEKELLTNMRKTTRYLIKQAQKNQDIEVFQTQKLEDLDIFSELHKKVSKTQRFIPFSLKYLKNEFSAFNTDNQVSMFFGKYKGEVVAVCFIVFWSGIGFYHHAALLPKYRKIPIAYLLQWEAIKEAKKRGCVLYDFWGYVDNPKHPWYGPTLFKMGFGGYADKYVKTQDLVLSPKYWLNYIIETIRRKKRGL